MHLKITNTHAVLSRGKDLLWVYCHVTALKYRVLTPSLYHVLTTTNYFLAMILCFWLWIKCFANNSSETFRHQSAAATFVISLGTALHLVVITEASGVAGVALALAQLLSRDLATRVGNHFSFSCLAPKVWKMRLSRIGLWTVAA